MTNDSQMEWFMFFVSVLPAGAAVVARSTSAASLNTILVGDDRRLHWPEPDL